MSDEASMFVEGETYELEMLEHGGGSSFVRGEVAIASGTLLKLVNGDGERIVNTAAHTFVGARLVRKLAADSIYQPGKAPSRV